MTDLTTIDLTRNDGSAASLGDWNGQVRLIVNVASKCGLTPQYEALEALYRQHKDRGLVVLGFPSNDFKGQEPGTDAEIADFCSTNYDVTFPIFAKAPVSGAGKQPLYAALTEAQPERQGDGSMQERLGKHGIETNAAPEVVWNFEKFLIDRDGEVIARFAPDIAPDDPRLTQAVESALDRA
ncbi:glutathione peroxidase [Paracoccus sp. Z118]|uniref:glutathione peroxidase n=1 Tax=Paracoccus sp. Z118 TaxID=2851017 RepID=UPI001C2C11F7|nr:glutathione peroxidase [Paracoccus sp. Z118]MBV0890425.1 glutathione peroxidase [Paracoccus sp. Z118]